MEFTKTKKVWLGVFVFLLLGTTLAFFLNPSRRQERIKPKRGDVIEAIYGLGTVTADKVFHLRTGIPLTLQKLFVREGDLVKINDPLVKLDEQLMTSPLEGTVTTVAFKQGELVNPQLTVITVTNMKSLFLEVSLEQQSVLRVKKGQEVLVSFESLRSEKYSALVESVFPRSNQFIVRIELANWPEGVLPGMTADVSIVIGKKSQVLLIPIASVIGGQVTRIRQGKKERLPIHLGIIDGQWGELTSENLTEEDELLLRKQ